MPGNGFDPMSNLSAPTPTISVVIPMYNAEAFLAEAIESVLGQTVPPSQVIVIDDGSTDQGATVARRYEKYIQLVQQPNAGSAATRNRGVALAHGDFFAFLDHDDYWAPEKLALQMDAFRRLPHLDAVFGQLEQTYTIEKTEQDRLNFGLNAQDGYHLNTLLIRRKAFHRIGPFDPAWTIDTLEWLWRARNLDLHIEMLPQVLAWRRIHGDNLSIRARAHLHAEYLRFARMVLVQQRSHGEPNNAV
ncbi:glycosyltransferase [bacterium]|nr:glycosyltransferase [bacterium]